MNLPAKALRATPWTKGIDRPTGKQPAEKTGHSGIPTRIEPARLGRFGGWVTMRCPPEFASVIFEAGGMWDPGVRQWCAHPRRVNQVPRELLCLQASWSTEPGHD